MAIKIHYYYYYYYHYYIDLESFHLDQLPTQQIPRLCSFPQPTHSIHFVQGSQRDVVHLADQKRPPI